MNFIPISSAQIQDTMARLSYFDCWGKDQLARLASGTKQFFLPKKEKLIGKGDLIDSLYVVVSGQVRLYIPLSNRSERVVSLVEQGQSFGEPCLIRAEPCPYEAVAGKDSHLRGIRVPRWPAQRSHHVRHVPQPEPLQLWLVGRLDRLRPWHPCVAETFGPVCLARLDRCG